MEEEQDIIHYSDHPHPLVWIRNISADSILYCSNCSRIFKGDDGGYRCGEECSFYLHEDCMEMARMIRHPLHPSHPLMQKYYSVDLSCAVCEVCGLHTRGKSYRCSRGCKFVVHLRCTDGHEVVPQENQVMKHPSHPQHALSLLRREKRLCSFQCDACGTTEKGNSYICIICNYWIHEGCANLPITTRFHHLHHHSLSLAFRLPYEYDSYGYNCDICDEAFRLRRWVYHCKLCRYVVHIKCATKAAPSTSTNNEDEANDPKIIIHVPVTNIYEQIIKPFYERVRGETFIPHEDQKIISKKHRHPLSLIKPSLSKAQDHTDEEVEEEEDDADDDDDDDIKIKCDGCTLPIHENSSSSNSYLSCDDCKYFLHLACFSLPQELSTHPLHQIQGHNLILRHSDNKLKYDHWQWCNICLHQTNGFYYSCTKCGFYLDIKCASMPDTIKHDAHPRDHHYLKLFTKENNQTYIIGSCYHIISGSDPVYRCDKCKFSVCCNCVFLPKKNRHRLDKHLLTLTYDAHVNHPSEFICGSCEGKMNPKSWMYYCRECDESFHIECCPTLGPYRNINFGMEQYYFSDHPQHPLRFQLITKKMRCDICYQDAYEKNGFQCISCNFIKCRYCSSTQEITSWQ